MFLEKKGYEVVTVTNGTDAIEQCAQRTFDLVLLDEMMPGLTGLETLQRIKEINPATPVVMVTKSEEEDIMDQAAGRIIIMPGCGVCETNIARIAQLTGAREFHFSAREAVKSAMRTRNSEVKMGSDDIDEYTRMVTTSRRVADTISALCGQ